MIKIACFFFFFKLEIDPQVLNVINMNDANNKHINEEPLQYIESNAFVLTAFK
jgi:hypothetical protein